MDAYAETDRLQEAMPATVAEFYAIVRVLDPKMWPYLRQHTEPRAAAIGAIQCMHQLLYAKDKIDAFISNVENLRSSK